MIRLSISRLSKLFWEIIFESSDYSDEANFKVFKDMSLDLENLRIKAKYDTGSISISQAYLLYLVVKFFRPVRVIEVGTFIGRSTFAMAQAMDTYCEVGEIYTCDISNDIKLPWSGCSKIFQFPMQSSLSMFQQLNGEFDFIFLDGRVVDEDLINLDRLITRETIIALDDFEGIEKGVVNLIFLRKLKKLSNHQILYPASEFMMKDNRFKGKSSLALLVPRDLIQFTNQ